MRPISTNTIDLAKSIRIRGLVQGVGFRPFVWQLAQKYELTGSVRNDGEGVLIEVSGTPQNTNDFIAALQENPPPLSRIDRIEVASVGRLTASHEFKIIPSHPGDVTTGVVPDAATCPACIEEVLNPQDRRSGYAFTNCTHCGPRLSILNQIPYDRASTSMTVFPMCKACEAEYKNPSDRRFHAQPNACPDCGPTLWYEDSTTNKTVSHPIKFAADRIKSGEIIAIKGIGGFQLAVDAGNDTAVQRLRQKKNRPDKPLALMAKDVNQIRAFCKTSEEEANWLRQPGSPIVLLSNRVSDLAKGIAPNQDRLGMMLPNTPLHHLLMAELDRPIVLTSGNLTGDPQETDNQKARQRLERIADGFLMHDRDIENRLDDSVVRIDKTGPSFFRRARGFAPAPVRLDASFANSPKVLAMGGELKSAFCLLNGQDAILSQHIGDLESAATFADYKKMIRLYLDLYQFTPEIIAVDKHPQYLSTVLGQKMAAEFGAELVGVQHHHAHLASCLAENHMSLENGETVTAIILDGLGYGTDKTIWGGEFLTGGFSGFERTAHFAPVSLPGGAAAALEPWRNLLAHLHHALGPDYRTHLAGLRIYENLCTKKPDFITQMIEKGVNAPYSSSCGRLFDAVAAALDLCFDQQTFEGQAAMRVEAAARPHLATAREYPLTLSDGSKFRIDFKRMWQALLGDLRADENIGVIAAKFHKTIISGCVQAIRKIDPGTNRRIILSGGVFQNALLRDGVFNALSESGFEVLVQKTIPANDGGLALGQAAIAATRAVNQTRNRSD